MTDSTDGGLLQAWASGDAQAGDRLVRRYFDPLYGFFRSKLSGEIDDLIQRTFLSALRTQDRLRDRSAFRGYLFAIARNELYAELRARLTDPVADLGASSMDKLMVGGSGYDPVNELAEHAEHVLLLRALRRLPLDDQIALELFYWKGLDAAEVGAAFHTTASGIRSRLARARARLAEVIRELGADARLAESTIDGFERWSASLGEQLPKTR